MEKFEVKGTFKVKGKECRFSKQIKANSENRAREMVLSVMGSNHKLSRRQITIVEIKKAVEEKNR